MSVVWVSSKLITERCFLRHFSFGLRSICFFKIAIQCHPLCFEKGSRGSLLLQSRLCLTVGEMLSAPKGWKKLHRKAALVSVSVCGSVSYTHCKDRFLPFSLLPTGVFCFPALQGLVRWEGAEEVFPGGSMCWYIWFILVTSCAVGHAHLVSPRELSTTQLLHAARTVSEQLSPCPFSSPQGLHFPYLCIASSGSSVDLEGIL